MLCYTPCYSGASTAVSSVTIDADHPAVLTLTGAAGEPADSAGA
jgi:hypothetical protein